jgi:hypothetical protein
VCRSKLLEPVLHDDDALSAPIARLGAPDGQEPLPSFETS